MNSEKQSEQSINSLIMEHDTLLLTFISKSIQKMLYFNINYEKRIDYYYANKYYGAE